VEVRRGVNSVRGVGMRGAVARGSATEARQKVCPHLLLQPQVCSAA